MSWQPHPLRYLLTLHPHPPPPLPRNPFSQCRAQSEVCLPSLNLLVATNSRLLTPGLLIECDPSIKAMILKYDEERHDYIVEDLDDENHLVIKESQLQNLKVRLDQV